MAIEITMPKFGQTMTEGTILEWLKEVGDYVQKGEVFLQIESDKATLGVEAEHSGYLLKTTAAEGEEVPCGQVVAYMGDEEEV